MPDTGEKDGGDMSKKTIYRDAPKDVAEAINAAEVVNDFLPPPEELLLRDETVKKRKGV